MAGGPTICSPCLAIDRREATSDDDPARRSVLGCPQSRSMNGRTGQRSLWRRTGIAFWLAVFGLLSVVAEALAASLLPVDLTLLAAGFVGAFIGSSPLMLIPSAARFAFGPHSAIGQPTRWQGQLLLLGVAVLVTAIAVARVWPQHTWTGRGISEAGIVAALAAGAFSAEFRRAGRLWISRKLSRPIAPVRRACSRAPGRPGR